MKGLKKCGCGEVPTELAIYGDVGKYSFVYGNCCGEWFIEVPTNWEVDEDVLADIIVSKWNDAYRLEDDEKDYIEKHISEDEFFSLLDEKLNEDRANFLKQLLRDNLPYLTSTELASLRDEIDFILQYRN